MKNFYITFGQISPFKDGYVRILATDKEKARELAFEVFGPKFAFLYDDESFDGNHFPAGQIGNTLVASEY